MQTARERKGVDLSRAERETKIRARHLMALESGDIADLPAPVYAKGFLRNYSTYLGLDAEEMLARWRQEIDQPRSAETPSVKPPPQPITTPSRGFKLTSGLVVALVLAAIVFTFVGYVGLQLVRFTQNPEITLSGPAIRQLQPNHNGFVRLSGNGDPFTAITATGADTGAADQIVRTTTAGASGSWSVSVPVVKGENHFTIVGEDPETARDSAPLNVIVTVPVEDGSIPDGDLAPALPDGVEDTNITGIPSAELTLLEPEKGLQTKSGKVEVAGTSDAESVTVSFRWRGNTEAEKLPPPDAVLAVGEDGVFRGTFHLSKGRWVAYVTASIDGGVPAFAEVPVKSLNDKMMVTVKAVDGKTRVRLVKPNGDIIAGTIQLKDGEKKTWRVDPDVIVRVGNAKAAQVSLDGISYGTMGKGATAAEWRLKQGEKPKKLD